MPIKPASSTPGRVRKIGLLKTAAGLLGLYLLCALGLEQLLEWLLNNHRWYSGALTYFLMLGMVPPFVMLWTGLWELVAGKPFRVLESAWGRLKEWQQGLFSFLIFLLAIGLLLLLIHWVTGVEFL